MKGALVLKEDITRESLAKSDLTTDCLFVHLDSGQIDLVRGQTMVKVFDLYHDAGKKIVQIELSGGRLNPKLSSPKLD